MLISATPDFPAEGVARVCEFTALARTLADLINDGTLATTHEIGEPLIWAWAGICR